VPEGRGVGPIEILSGLEYACGIAHPVGKLEAIVSSRAVRWYIVGVAILAGAGCQAARDFLPRTHTTSTSPDGRSYAFVRQHLNPDPPDDHLYIGRVGGPATHVLALAPDADWCRTIIWTPDSQTVGFLVSDQRLALFNVRTMELIAMTVLVVPDGYPGSQEARNVAIANDGAISFERVVRATTLLHPRGQGIIEAPVTSHGTFGRPIHRQQRSLGVERVHVSLTAAS
jgi:hypothetical protein